MDVSNGCIDLLILCFVTNGVIFAVYESYIDALRTSLNIRPNANEEVDLEWHEEELEWFRTKSKAEWWNSIMELMVLLNEMCEASLQTEGMYQRFVVCMYIYTYTIYFNR